MSPEDFEEQLAEEQLEEELEEEAREARPEEREWELEDAENVVRSARIRKLIPIVREFRRLVSSEPLISQAAAARVLDVTPGYIGELIAEGKLTQLHFPALGVIGVTIDSVLAYRARRRQRELPDAETELRRLKAEREEYEQRKQTRNL